MSSSWRRADTARPEATTVPALLDTLGNQRSDAIALLAPGRVSLSFGRLRDHVERLAGALAATARGVRPRVGIVFPDGPELATIVLAAMSAGAAAPLNPRYTQAEFEAQLESLGADLLVLDARLDSPARRAAEARAIPVVHTVAAADDAAGLLQLESAVHPPGARSTPLGEDVALLLHTSGTTAKPKVVPLTHANLLASATNISAWLRLTPDDRCLNVMPLFHIHGLMAALLASLRAGASVACTPGFLAPEVFGWIEELEPTWYTAVPTMHQAIVARASQVGLSRVESDLRFIRSSSAPLAPELLADLETLFHAPVIEAYGMTEAAHQMTSNPLPPGKRKPGSVGLPAGTDVAIVDEAGVLLPSGRVGEIVVRGPGVTSGYEGNPTANAEAFTAGWFRTGDQGVLDEDGYLHIRGRIKELINRGGEKISPREIDETLTGHPAVREALAFALPDERLGEEVGAAVVLQEGAAADETELLRFAAERLASFKLPRRIVFLEDLPKGSTGKLQRIGLAQRLGLATPGASPALADDVTPPETATQETLSQIWAEVLGLARVGIHQPFLSLGGDSMLATLLLARVRDRLEAELSMLEFFEADTVAAQATLIDQKRKAT